MMKKDSLGTLTTLALTRRGAVIQDDVAFIHLMFDKEVTPTYRIPATSVCWDLLRTLLRGSGEAGGNTRMVIDHDSLCHGVVMCIRADPSAANVMADALNLMLITWPRVMSIVLDEETQPKPILLGVVMSDEGGFGAASTSISEYKQGLLEMIPLNKGMELLAKLPGKKSVGGDKIPGLGRVFQERGGGPC